MRWRSLSNVKLELYFTNIYALLNTQAYERSHTMKKLLTITAAALVLTSTAANAWTDRWGHWHEGPTLYGPINPGAVYAPYGAPPAYFYGPPPPAVYGYGGPAYGGPAYGGPAYGGPVFVAPPTDAQVIAGTILGIAGMFAHGRHW
jgi:hypothetical protein